MTSKTYWFQLIDTNADAYMGCSVLDVELSNEKVVSNFLRAVKIECPNYLSSFDPNALKAYKDKDAFRNNDSLNPFSVMSNLGLGLTEETIILVLVPSARPVKEDPASIDEKIVDYLESLIGKQLTEPQLRTLYTKFSNCIPLIRMKKLGVMEVRRLLKSVDCVLKTKSLEYMIEHEGYVFDGLIGSSGLSNALMYRVFSCTAPVAMFCAKVYLNQEDARHEAAISSIIHNPDQKAEVVYYNCITVRHLHLQNDSMALLMPIYLGSLEDAIDAFQGYPFPLSYFISLSKGILRAVNHFHTKDLCHCDVKPANLMLQNDLSPVLIDLGAVSQFGKEAKEYTNFYCLDAALGSVNPKFDLNCVVTTLARCFVPSFELKSRSKDQMVEILSNQNDQLQPYANICISILESSSANEAISRIQQDSLTICACVRYLNSGKVVNLLLCNTKRCQECFTRIETNSETKALKLTVKSTNDIVPATFVTLLSNILSLGAV